MSHCNIKQPLQDNPTAVITFKEKYAFLKTHKPDYV